MHTERLVTMANEIAAFFAAEDPQNGAESVATHLLRYWNPRMREQIIAYAKTDGYGLVPMAKAAVEILARRDSK
jgi:formate dehydrogenase subunit delta